MSVICPYCDKPARLVTGHAIYPHRPDLLGKKFWLCTPCDAWVGCHPRNKKHKHTGAEPLGRLANGELRKAKQAAHAAFDPLWRSKTMSRKEAYQWLASQLGISPQNCHIGMMDVDSCKSVVAVMAARGKA